MTKNIRAGQAREAQEAAEKEIDKGNIVHLFDTSEPHWVDGDEICWCNPAVNRYDTGGALIRHKAVTWQ